MASRLLRDEAGLSSAILAGMRLSSRQFESNLVQPMLGHDSLRFLEDAAGEQAIDLRVVRSEQLGADLARVLSGLRRPSLGRRGDALGAKRRVLDRDRRKPGLAQRAEEVARLQLRVVRVLGGTL